MNAFEMGQDDVPILDLHLVSVRKALTLPQRLFLSLQPGVASASF